MEYIIVFVVAIIAIIAIVAVSVYVNARLRADENEPGAIRLNALESAYTAEEQAIRYEGMPIFGTGAGIRKKPCSSLYESQSVWVISPTGPEKMIVEKVKNIAVIRSSKYEVKAICVQTYFSQSVATKLGIPRKVWCLDSIRYLDKSKKDSCAKDINEQWIRDDSLFGDFFGVTEIFLDLIMYGMPHSMDHYNDVFPLEGEEVANEEIIESVVDEEKEIAAVLEVAEQIEVTPEIHEPIRESYSPPAESYSPPDSGGYSSGGGGDCGGGDGGSD